MSKLGNGTNFILTINWASCYTL